MVRSLRAVLLLGVSVVAAHAGTIYDLTNDFSNVSNPNGVWAFLQGGTPLAHFIGTTPNSLNNALANGYWGTGTDLNVNTPEVGKTTGDGAVSGETVLDYLSGDVLVHSSNSGGDSIITWTAPTAGTIDFTGSIWYGHSSVNRSNNYVVTLNGGQALFSGLVNLTTNYDRDHRGTFGNTGLAVNAGDVLALDIGRTAGQVNGSIDGVTLNVDFTAAAPEPASWALLMSGVGLMAWRKRRAA